MDGKKRKIFIGNIGEYISKERIDYLTSRSTTEKLNPAGLIVTAVFFSGMIIILPGMLFYLINMAKLQNIKYFEVNDIFAMFLHDGIYAWLVITILYFFFFIYALFKNFYKNKIKRLYNIMIVLITYLCFITMLLFLIGVLFIPVTIGIFLRYFLITVGLLTYILFSIYWFKKRVKVFYKITQKSVIDQFINKIRVWIWPILGIASVISFTTAPFRRDARLAFYGAISPFFILLLIPFAYLTFYFTLGYFLEIYYINKFPEAIRMETDFTKEEWYGPKYQKSKEVMQKIQDFENYINN